MTTVARRTAHRPLHLQEKSAQNRLRTQVSFAPQLCPCVTNTPKCRDLTLQEVPDPSEQVFHHIGGDIGVHEFCSVPFSLAHWVPCGPTVSKRRPNCKLIKSPPQIYHSPDGIGCANPPIRTPAQTPKMPKVALRRRRSLHIGRM